MKNRSNVIQALDVAARAEGPDGQNHPLTAALSDYERHVDVSQAMIFIAMGANLMRRNSSHVIFPNQQTARF